MIKPIKELLPYYSAIEDQIIIAIFNKYHLDISLLHYVKKFDIEAQEIEFSTFYQGANMITKYLDPEQALKSFIQYFNSIQHRR